MRSNWRYSHEQVWSSERERFETWGHGCSREAWRSVRRALEKESRVGAMAAKMVASHKKKLLKANTLSVSLPDVSQDPAALEDARTTFQRFTEAAQFPPLLSNPARPATTTYKWAGIGANINPWKFRRVIFHKHQHVCWEAIELLLRHPMG